MSAQLDLGLDSSRSSHCDHSAEMRDEYEAIARSNYYEYRKRARRNEIDGVPFVLGGAVVLQHGDIGASHCGILDWSGHTECGFDPDLPEGMRDVLPAGPDVAHESWNMAPVLPSFQDPLSSVVCERCHSVEGIAMHLYDAGGLQAAFERMAGFSGEFWECVRLELRR